MMTRDAKDQGSICETGFVFIRSVVIFEGETVKSWNQNSVTCSKTSWLGHFDMTFWQQWYFDVIILSWRQEVAASKCENSVLLPNKGYRAGIPDPSPPLSSITPQGIPFLSLNVHFNVVYIFILYNLSVICIFAIVMKIEGCGKDSWNAFSMFSHNILGEGAFLNVYSDSHPYSHITWNLLKQGIWMEL